jgi:protoheme IX farnesyltransferase
MSLYSLATTVVGTRRGAAVAARLADYLELTKPRIVCLELIVAAMAAFVATPHDANWPVLLAALAGTALVAGSASAANQWWEREVDRRMPRTAGRPLPAGRIAPAEAMALSVAMLLMGTAWLWSAVNPLTAVLGVTSWILYVLIYTPLKSRTTLNTAVGAVSGAIPLLMGWTATGAPLDLTAWSLAGVLFLWQFPHFMAIAWLYRRDYAAAGHQMTTVVDPSGARSGALAVLGAAALAPVSLIPALSPSAGSPWIYSLWCLTLAGGFLALAVRFAVCRDTTSARYLLRGSLLYLPTWMFALLLVSL